MRCISSSFFSVRFLVLVLSPNVKNARVGGIEDRDVWVERGFERGDVMARE